MKRARDFSLSVDHFPSTLTAEHQPSPEEAPALPNLKKRPIEQSQFFTPPPLLPTVIEAQQNIAVERLKRAVSACKKYSDNLQMIQNLAQDIEEIHDIIPVFDSLNSLSIEQRGLLINVSGAHVNWMFNVNSQDALMDVFQSTPKTHHLGLIRLFAKEIYHLHATQAQTFT